MGVVRGKKEIFVFTIVVLVNALMALVWGNWVVVKSKGQRNKVRNLALSHECSVLFAKRNKGTKKFLSRETLLCFKGQRNKVVTSVLFLMI